MSLFSVMVTGVSGMSAQANRLSAIADNIANVNTTGYKRVSTEFSSAIVNSGSGQYNSGAVATNIRYAISDLGHLQFTTSTTDLAVQGNGFFVVSDSSGAEFLTRTGSFVPDSQGNLVNAAGFRLMGYNIQNGTPNVVANGFGGLQAVNINQTNLRAQPSTTATVNANLDPSTPIVAGPPSTAFTSKSSVVAYDNIGRAVTLDTYMFHTAPDTWQIEAFDASTSLSPTGSGFPYAGPPLDSKTFSFDTSATGRGALAGTSPTSLSFTIPGGSAFTMNLSAITQVASSFNFKTTVDGNAPAAVDKVDIDPTGQVTAILQNGTQKPLFKVPLVDFPARDSLTSEVGNVYSLNPQSGNAQVGFAGQSGFGTVQSGALEESNVDPVTELTSMIEAEVAFVANSKSVQTAAEMLDEILKLKR